MTDDQQAQAPDGDPRRRASDAFVDAALAVRRGDTDEARCLSETGLNALDEADRDAGVPVPQLYDAEAPYASLAMPALSVYPPWSHAIAWLAKPVENRSWPVPPPLIGADIAIHATKTIDHAAIDAGRPLSWPHEANGIPPVAWPPVEDMAAGAVVAVAQIVGCHHASDCVGPLMAAHYGIDHDTLCSPWAAWGQYHWQLANVRPLLEPVECRGHQRIWYLPDDVETDVQLQLMGLVSGYAALDDTLARVTVEFWERIRRQMKAGS